MRKILAIAGILAVLGAAGYGYYRYSTKPEAPSVNTARITRGDIAETVGATGQLQAVTTVQVGTQVSGTIQELNADFNSLVHQGQILARLDASSFRPRSNRRVRTCFARRPISSVCAWRWTTRARS
jgi:HlyD family secretion protein